MPAPLLVIIGFILLIMGIWGMVTGKIIAGSRGIHANYYHKSENPFFYYTFVFIYLFIGALVLYKAL